MNVVTLLHRSAALILLEGTLAFAQGSMLSTTPPTSGVPPVTASRSSTEEARVTYSQGRLQVDANNSSLNRILRQISRATGMKITGTVADMRVFGEYGPAAPAEILENLLEGAGVNMLLQETASAAPAELILTPRNGPPSPPNPPAAPDTESTAAASPSPQSAAPPIGWDGVIRDINGNPAPAGSLIPATTPPPSETYQQIQQRLQQAQQMQQQLMQQHHGQS